VLPWSEIYKKTNVVIVIGGTQPSEEGLTAYRIWQHPGDTIAVFIWRDNRKTRIGAGSFGKSFLDFYVIHVLNNSC